MMRKRNQIVAHVDAETWHCFDEAARHLGDTRSALLRKLIVNWLETNRAGRAAGRLHNKVSRRALRK